MPHSRCVVHHKLVRLDPLRLTQPSHLEHLHNSELQLGGIELQLRSHLNGQRRDIGGFKQGSSELGAPKAVAGPAPSLGAPGQPELPGTA